ncbi:MAG: translation initiation factor IF-2 [Candidatus Omnitrophica bacterium]|nr:translation initiation factor IF-2 [Candidatus Omnitrophota bacterium]
MIKKTEKKEKKPVAKKTSTAEPKKKIAEKSAEAKPKVKKEAEKAVPKAKPSVIKKAGKIEKKSEEKGALKVAAVKTESKLPGAKQTDIAKPEVKTERPQDVKKVEEVKPAPSPVKTTPKPTPAPVHAETKKIEPPVQVKPVEKVTDTKDFRQGAGSIPGKVETAKQQVEIEEPGQPPAPKALEFDTPLTLKELAIKIGVKPNELIVNLMSKNIFATINQNIGEDIVVNILSGYGFEYRKPSKAENVVASEHKEMEEKQDVKHLVTRPPVVTFMGHVDHGKTSLLDFIRKTRVADREKGGITQHIGAYEVKFKNGSVTFLDTPGHEAFTAMRARGANATDVVVLVVAADDGVMPQTKEALDHARAAGVTIVVALNKCDLPSANIDKVKGQLASIGLSPEDWGGKTIVIPVSAKTGEGVEQLLEMLILESELLELKANPNLRARGVVIEGKLSSGQGPVSTVLVKNGTLRVGDMVLTGMHYGRIKAMMDHAGNRIEEAGPSKPAIILGLSGVPMAGDEFFSVKDEKKARTLSMLKQDEARAIKLRSSKRVTLEDFYSKMKEGVTKELNILLKGDVQGSVEALKASLLELSAKDVKVNVIHADVGNINESDVMLAMVSNAVVIGFNVKIDEGAEAVAAKEGIEIKVYGIIYEAIQDVVAAMEGLLEPVSSEVFVGRAMVKQVFQVTKSGTIAGCMVTKGKIVRTGIAKLIRDKEVVHTGKIGGLKRFKDDAREVAEGFECGIGLERHNDIKAGDIIEMYRIEKVARRLTARK